MCIVKYTMNWTAPNTIWLKSLTCQPSRFAIGKHVEDYPFLITHSVKFISPAVHQFPFSLWLVSRSCNVSSWCYPWPSARQLSLKELHRHRSSEVKCLNCEWLLLCGILGLNLDWLMSWTYHGGKIAFFSNWYYMSFNMCTGASNFSSTCHAKIPLVPDKRTSLNVEPCRTTACYSQPTRGCSLSSFFHKYIWNTLTSFRKWKTMHDNWSVIIVYISFQNIWGEPPRFTYSTNIIAHFILFNLKQRRKKHVCKMKQ